MLIEHAKYELQKAGLFDADSDYDGELGHGVLALIELFASQGHSMYSAIRTAYLFGELAAYRPLTPITSDPDEWIDRSEISGFPIWQNRRSTSAFSKDGGATWYDVDSPTK
jgi:hypothetical protein